MIRLDQTKSNLIRSESTQGWYFIGRCLALRLGFHKAPKHSERLETRNPPAFCPHFVIFVIVKDLRGDWGVKTNHDRCAVLPAPLQVLNDSVTWTIFSWAAEMRSQFSALINAASLKSLMLKKACWTQRFPSQEVVTRLEHRKPASPSRSQHKTAATLLLWRLLDVIFA